MVSQSERRALTRSALLDSAVRCLVDGGTARFTTAAVAGRAGLSNGALFGHFSSRQELLAATVAHVLEGLRDDYEHTFRRLTPDERTAGRLVELLWRVMAEPGLAAVYDVYTAARTDPALRAAIDPVCRDHVRRWRVLARELVTELPGVDPDDAGPVTSLAIWAMQGLVLNQMAMPDPEAVGELARALDAVVGGLLAPTATAEWATRPGAVTAVAVGGPEARTPDGSRP